jgi:hypothetical protein
MVQISGELRFSENSGNMQRSLTNPGPAGHNSSPAFQINGTIAFAGSRRKKSDAGTGFLP